VAFAVHGARLLYFDRQIARDSAAAAGDAPADTAASERTA
jgi:hypothetical protein